MKKINTRLLRLMVVGYTCTLHYNNAGATSAITHPNTTAAPTLKHRSRPLGVQNLHGTCYLSAAIQVLEAAFNARPELMQKVLYSANTKFINSFKKTRDNIKKPFGIRKLLGHIAPNFFSNSSLFVHGLIYPYPLAQDWKDTKPERYGTIPIKSLNDPSGWPVGGHSSDVLTLFFLECNKTLEKPLFTIYENATTNLVDSQALSEATEFIVVNNSCSRPMKFVPPLNIEVKVPGKTNNSTYKIKYRLIAIIRGHFTPQENKEDKGANNSDKVGSWHSLCFVNYGVDTWFCCDDSRITPTRLKNIENICKNDMNQDSQNSSDVALYVRIDEAGSAQPV